MNLISCEGCGVVLDKDNLKFPEELLDDEYCFDETRAVWVDDGYFPFTDCPVCGGKVIDCGWNK